MPWEPDSGGGLSSRWVKQSISGLLAVTVHLVRGIKDWLVQDIKHGGTAASHSLLNVADLAKREHHSVFPLSDAACDVELILLR